MRSVRVKILCIACMVALLVLCTACSGAATKKDLSSLQSEVNRLTLSNYDLTQRVAALEAIVNTPVATATPIPTVDLDSITPVPTSTPGPATYGLSADEICSQMMKNGMPISGFIKYTMATDPERVMGTEMGYISRSDFLDKTASSNIRGAVEVFKSGNDAMARETELNARFLDGTRDFEIIFRYDNVILRLPSPPFTDEQCISYEDALRKVLSDYR